MQEGSGVAVAVDVAVGTGVEVAVAGSVTVGRDIRVGAEVVVVLCCGAHAMSNMSANIAEGEHFIFTPVTSEWLLRLTTPQHAAMPQDAARNDDKTQLSRPTLTKSQDGGVVGVCVCLAAFVYLRVPRLRF